MQVKKRTTYYFLMTALLFACRFANAQGTVDDITRSFNAYRNSHLQEKLFVHTGKAFYMAGEIIWFKVYAADAFFNRPLDLSRISYVEVLNKEHKPVLQAKIAMADGSGNGSFQLPYSVNSGNYLLRAYTNWMKNSSAELFFETTITVVNALKKPDWPEADKPAYDLQFFPEGGNLVAGIQSKLAFRAVDANGKSLDCTGAILDNKNDTIARFSSFRFGMGHFLFTPQTGDRYHALIKTADGAVIQKELPAAASNGIVMRVEDMDKDRLNVSIQNNGGNAKVSLLIHTRQSLKLALTKELVNGITEIAVDKKQLGEGISQLTVFNAAGQPVCERLYFKKPAGLSVIAKPDAGNYATRKKVTIDLSTAGPNAEPVPGNMSVSVYPIDSLQSLSSQDIRSYLWLSSELKGFIESPSFYFSAEPGAEEAADNLMLTQGWRRFRWENMLQVQKNEPEFLPETEGHLINGRLVDKRNGRAVENSTAFLSVPGEKALFNTAVSGKNGTIQFNLKNFYGGNEIVLQPANFADSNYRVDIASPFAEKYSDRTVPVFSLPESSAALLTSYSLHSQVGNAYSNSKQQRFLFPAGIDTIPFYGVPDKRYYLDDYTRFITMEEVMREFIADVRVRKNNEQFSYRVRNSAFDNFLETDPLVLIDGVPVYNVDKIIAFDPLKVKRIDVVAQKFYQNNVVHDGIVSYSTYQGDLAGYQLDVNALIVEYEGMQLEREFYSPVYETASQINSRLPDFRNVLYWSPDLHTAKDGKKQFSFYTADIPGRYVVVVQGIAANGLAGSYTATFNVTK